MEKISIIKPREIKQIAKNVGANIKYRQPVVNTEKIKNPITKFVANYTNEETNFWTGPLGNQWAQMLAILGGTGNLSPELMAGKGVLGFLISHPELIKKVIKNTASGIANFKPIKKSFELIKSDIYNTGQDIKQIGNKIIETPIIKKIIDETKLQHGITNDKPIKHLMPSGGHKNKLVKGD